MQGNPEPLAPPVVQGQIQAAAGRRRKRCQQRLQGLQGLGGQVPQTGGQGLKFGSDGSGGELTVSGVEATGLTDPGQAVLLHLHQQVLHGRSGAAADRQGHGLGEGKGQQTQFHGHKLAQPAADAPPPWPLVGGVPGIGRAEAGS